MAVRAAILAHHYRSDWEWSEQVLADAQALTGDPTITAAFNSFDLLKSRLLVPANEEEMEAGEEVSCGFLVTCRDTSEMLDDVEEPFDEIAFAIEREIAIALHFSVRLWRDDSFDPTTLQIGTDGIGIVSLVGKKRLGLPFGQINQIVIGFAVRRFARREVEGDGPASGITETMNFTGEPAPRAAKSASMTPLFPPLPRRGRGRWCCRCCSGRCQP